MGVSTINAKMVKNAFLAGAKGLSDKKEWINELNVFPVPDGDTGTNMTLTIMAAAKEVAALNDPSMEQLAKAISSGSLRGARGNSGVILSQLLRGFTKEIKTVDEIDTTTLANAMVRGTETAYKAVMKPKEGTILTVAKGMADKALEMAAETDDIETFAQAVIKEGDRVLNLTPEMLPVLKQAGVVDSGGQGLMQVIKGAFDGLTGNVTDFTLDGAEAPANGAAEKTVQTGNGAARTDIDTADIKFGYCTEFIIKLEKKYTDEDEEELKKYLGSIGDSLVVVSDDEIVKIHVHTNHPGLAFEKGLTYGSLSRMKVDNMREEHEERVIQDSERLAKEQAQADTVKQEEKEEPEERREYGFIAVSCGDGLSEIFKGIGADYLIEGGQTMNPSTEDMLNAIAHVNADHIFILPNNKNIILAANQARDLTEDKEIIVVPSKTVPQGITALVNFMPDLTSKENLENMTAEMERVKTAQITYAVRTTNIDGMEIEKGDIMAIGDKGMLAVEHSPEEAAKAALKAMLDEDSELVTIYYGCDVKEEDAEKLKEEAEKEFPDKELELQYGGQPIYYYMISAE
ncbi:MAG: DAK2 domain-containing protein [Lachnospiraceae bacterium]|nr:MAG: DAK2 domain-containing protein [Lachnospiraceae bacterium]